MAIVMAVTPEPGSEGSCLRGIVRTGNPEIDKLSAAIEAATAEDLALFAIAVNRKQRSTNATNGS